MLTCMLFTVTYDRSYWNVSSMLQTTWTWRLQPNYHARVVYGTDPFLKSWLTDFLLIHRQAMILLFNSMSITTVSYSQNRKSWITNCGGSCYQTYLFSISSHIHTISDQHRLLRQVKIARLNRLPRPVAICKTHIYIISHLTHALNKIAASYDPITIDTYWISLECGFRIMQAIHLDIVQLC
jgi:hypothetical protein